MHFEPALAVDRHHLFAQAGGYGAIGLFSAACMLASLATLIYSGMLRSEAEPVPGSRREEAVWRMQPSASERLKNLGRSSLAKSPTS
ncbi:Protein of unknown function [Thermobacillus xylanilyticus]|uniref:Uncharacterized protein n=1 Tax=Thermobacillus xylanilyticus TaxID=76633 RepID=A0ABM8V611_THEXY|nr:hypothetical protein [Thermobacillus xylanilyticus]CAG5089400.1 Protein of unknown function [Thermobacillus xylanilyticus]